MSGALLSRATERLSVRSELRRTRLTRPVACRALRILQVPPHRHSRQAGLARNRSDAPALTPQYPYLHCLLPSQHGRPKSRHLLPGGPLLPRRSGSHYSRRQHNGCPHAVRAAGANCLAAYAAICWHRAASRVTRSQAARLSRTTSSSVRLRGSLEPAGQARAITQRIVK
jgi:hypothetical protein